MKKPLQCLAWRRYPEPGGTGYNADDLKNEKTVEIIFDYCQIFEATIFAKGWHLLFKTHGMDGLIRINKRSGWFDEKDDAEAEQMFIYHARIGGYDPEQEVFGKYNEETGEFTPEDEKV